MVIYRCPRCGNAVQSKVVKPHICDCFHTVTLMYQDPRFYCDGYVLWVAEDPATTS